MKGWKKALIATTAIAFSAMPVTGAFAQNNMETKGVSPIPSQRITMNAAAGTGTGIGVSPAGVRRVQQELNRLGYNAGSLTGTWDKATRTAAIEFQKARGLEPTGQLDFSTIAALGLTRSIVTNPMYPGMPSSEYAKSANYGAMSSGAEGGAGMAEGGGAANGMQGGMGRGGLAYNRGYGGAGGGAYGGATNGAIGTRGAGGATGATGAGMGGAGGAGTGAGATGATGAGTTGATGAAGGTGAALR